MVEVEVEIHSIFSLTYLEVVAVEVKKNKVKKRVKDNY